MFYISFLKEETANRYLSKMSGSVFALVPSLFSSVVQTNAKKLANEKVQTTVSKHSLEMAENAARKKVNERVTALAKAEALKARDQALGVGKNEAKAREHALSVAKNVAHLFI